MIDLPLPIVRQHRDFRPVNIIREESGKIAVIDWRDFGSAPPFAICFTL